MPPSPATTPKWFPPMTDPGNPSIPGKSCPVCGRPAVVPFLPFCSRRCADLDLGRWLKESYRIAASEEEGDPDEEG